MLENSILIAVISNQSKGLFTGMAGLNLETHHSFPDRDRDHHQNWRIFYRSKSSKQPEKNTGTVRPIIHAVSCFETIGVTSHQADQEG